MSDARIGYLRITITVVAALIFAVLPLPSPIDAARPDLLLLLVIYWALRAPRLTGLLFAWTCGLAIDVLKGISLGQHALGFALVAYLAHKFQLRIRIFPISQQSLTVAGMLLAYQGLIWYLDGVIGDPIITWMRWLPVITGALLWPALVALLDTWNRARR